MEFKESPPQYRAMLPMGQVRNGQQQLAGLWRHDHERVECASCSRPFTVFSRRHHCRVCGDIFCSNCTSNRVLTGNEGLASCLLSCLAPWRLEGLRTCNPCIDNLLIEGSIRRVSRHRRTFTLATGGPIRRYTLGNPLLACLPRSHSEDDNYYESCPVCQRRFTHKENILFIQRHIDFCLNEKTGGEDIGKQRLVVGDRYMSYRYAKDPLAEDGPPEECPICFDYFLPDQSISILTCLCQYHEKCIKKWFIRSHGCPFHCPPS